MAGETEIQLWQQQSRGKIHGYRYVHLWLEKCKGIHRNPKTVLREMQRYGLMIIAVFETLSVFNENTV